MVCMDRSQPTSFAQTYFWRGEQDQGTPPGCRGWRALRKERHSPAPGGGGRGLWPGVVYMSWAGRGSAYLCSGAGPGEL